MRNNTARDALGSSCGIQLGSGEYCEAKPAEDMPFPICARHAIQVTVAVQEFSTKRLLASSVDHRRIRQQRERGSVVYYVELPGDRIKIGTTINLPQRLDALRVGREAILATEPGGLTLERQRHRQFDAYRIGKREDFRDVPMLREWITEIKRQQG